MNFNLDSETIRNLIIGMVVFWIAGSIHEFAHAFSAFLMGDDTAKQQGRLTLNPLAHLDIFGTVLFPLIGGLTGAPVLGWMRPVPVNPNAFENPSKGQALTAAAGPLSNLLQAAAAIIIIKTAFVFKLPPNSIMYEILSIYFYMNVNLMIFNLIPFPPLDGGWILRHVLPTNGKILYDRVYPFGMMILYAVLVFGLLSAILNPVNRFFMVLLGFFLYTNIILSFIPIIAILAFVYFIYKKSVTPFFNEKRYYLNKQPGQSFIENRLNQIKQINSRIYNKAAPLLKKIKEGISINALEQNHIASIKAQAAINPTLCEKNAFDLEREPCKDCANYPNCIDREISSTNQ